MELGTNTRSEQKIGYKQVLKQKSFMIYILANVISRFGDSLDSIAYSWMVYEITGSTALMATLFGVNAIPNIIFQPLAGVYVDYRSKKKIQFVCNLGRGLIVALTAFLFLTGSLKVYYLFIFTFINSTLEAFQGPSSTALLPLILEKEHYAHGTAIQSTASRTSELVGLGVAGAIIAFLGVSGALLIDAATFIICGIMILFLKHKPEELKKEKLNFTTYNKDFKEGLKYLKTHKLILYICVFAAAVNALLVPYSTLNVPYVKDVLELGPEAISIMGISFTVGMMLGSIIFPKLKTKFKGINLFVIAGVFMGVLYLIFAANAFVTIKSMIYTLLILASVIGGGSVAILNMIVNVVFMEKVDHQYLGRASGVMSAMCMCAMPLGAFVVGGISMVFNVEIIYIVSGIAIMILFAFQKLNKILQDL